MVIRVGNVNIKCLIVSAMTMPIVLSFIDFSITNSVINAGNMVYGLFFDYLLEKPISLYTILGMAIYFLFSKIANRYVQQSKYENIWIDCFSGAFGLIFYLGKSYFLMMNCQVKCNVFEK